MSKKTSSTEPTPTQSLSAAIKQWSEKHPSDQKLEEQKHVKLYCTTPPIDKIDNAINVYFKNCVRLSLSTNCIEKIPLLPGASLPNLQVLSLGRNLIKKITGLDEIGATLKELWISYNQITALDGLGSCVKLETLFIANNRIKETSELKKLSANTSLVNANFLGNPFADGVERAESRRMIIGLVPQIKTLDGELYTEAAV